MERSIERIGWIDQAKGFGIILVVVAHIIKQDTPFVLFHHFADFIFLFHMPLFFILSGYLYKSYEPKILLERRLLTLGVPYVVYLILMTVLSFRHNIPASFTAFADHIFPYFLGGAYMTGTTGILWFITCLLTLQVCYNFFFRKICANTPFDRRVVFFVCLCAVLGYVWSYGLRPYKLPMALEIVPMATVFYWLGHCLAQNNLLFSSKTLCISTMGAVVAGFMFMINAGGG